MIQEFFSALAVLLICSLLCSGQELFLNSDLENGVNDWLHNGFTLQAEASEVYEGSASAKCIDRSQYYQGPGQNVPVERKKRYLFSSYVKLINDLQDGYGQTVGATMTIDWSDDGSTEYIPVASRRFVKPSDGWVMIEGDFLIADRPFTRAYLHIQGPDPGIEFYFDSASLTEIPENTNWEVEANQRIESLRKSNVNFKFNVGSNFDASDIEVQIDHKRHLFGFGSLVDVANMLDGDMYQYQDIVYYLFNWATVQDYKWLFNKGNRTNPDYRDAVKVTDWLMNHGLKVRGHCMFWAVPGHEPGWVSPLKGQDLETAVDEHIAYMTNISMGKLSHWDVNNELLHGEVYEQGTDNPDYTYHMFRQVHKADPVPTLFLNDYSVVRDGSYTRAFLDQIEKFKAADVSLGGVGVQSHFQNGVTPDPTLLKRRLDLLAQPGIPMWATELDIINDDEAERADWLEIIFRMFFSHPAMEGIILWNFWDHDMDVNKALLHGYFFVPGDAGQRYLDLVKGEWSTHVNQSLASGTSFDQRVFQGDYDLTVWHQGRPIQRTSFSVGKEDSTVTLDIDGDGQEIELPVEKDPFAKANQDKAETSYEGMETLGMMASTSQSQQLQCVTRSSNVSKATNNAVAQVQCDADEVLTSCSGYLTNNDFRRNGETIVFRNLKGTCLSRNGYRTTGGVQAFARCCSLQGLSCEYRMAGPSGTGIDDTIEVPCPFGNDALGCTTYSYNAESDGSYFNEGSCSAQNDDPASGVFAYNACCKAPNMECSIAYSTESGPFQGDMASIKCPAGQVMTGCNVFSKYGRAAGAYIKASGGEDICYAVNGYNKYGGEVGVQAIASCCHL